MKINRKSGDGLVYAEDVPIGQVFEYETELYQRLNVLGKPVDATYAKFVVASRLCDGMVEHHSKNAKVKYHPDASVNV